MYASINLCILTFTIFVVSRYGEFGCPDGPGCAQRTTDGALIEDCAVTQSHEAAGIHAGELHHLLAGATARIELKRRRRKYWYSPILAAEKKW